LERKIKELISDADVVEDMHIISGKRFAQHVVLDVPRKCEDTVGKIKIKSQASDIDERGFGWNRL